MTSTNTDIGKDNKLFLLFKHQSNGVAELQPTEVHKIFVKGITFMDMLLLTLPEKIMQRCKESKEEYIVPPNAFRFLTRTKGC
jgi:hypothetical protein